MAFEVMNKVTGNAVTVVDVETVPDLTSLGAKSKLLFWVYNSISESWEQRDANDYYLASGTDTNRGEVTISTEQQLNEALANPLVKVIKADALTLQGTNTIEWRNYTNKKIINLSVIETIDISATDHKAIEMISCDNIEFEGLNVSLDLNGATVGDWNSAYVIQLYNCSNITFSGTTILHGDMVDTAILCNGTNGLNIKGNFSISDCEFGGIELTKGSAANRFDTVSITFDPDCALSMTTEVYPTVPFLYTDGAIRYSVSDSGNKLPLEYINDTKNQKFWFTKSL